MEQAGVVRVTHVEASANEEPGDFALDHSPMPPQRLADLQTRPRIPRRMAQALRGRRKVESSYALACGLARLPNSLHGPMTRGDGPCIYQPTYGCRIPSP